MSDNENATGMDEAAKAAAEELNRSMTITDVAEWWKRHFTKAGHKRLGRALVKYAESKT